jgi:hypothetical protein
LKAKTDKRDTETEANVKTRSCISRLYPIADPMKTMGKAARAGCKREEKTVPTNPLNEVTEKTNIRSIRAPLKPKKKNLIQSSGAPRRELIKLPRMTIANQMREEKKERAEQRLKLKMRSFFMKLYLIITSENKVRTKKLAPKLKPATKFSRERFRGRIDRIPPWRTKTPRYIMSLF